MFVWKLVISKSCEECILKFDKFGFFSRLFFCKATNWTASIQCVCKNLKYVELVQKPDVSFRPFDARLFHWRFEVRKLFTFSMSFSRRRLLELRPSSTHSKARSMWKLLENSHVPFQPHHVRIVLTSYSYFFSKILIFIFRSSLFPTLSVGLRYPMAIVIAE